MSYSFNFDMSKLSQKLFKEIISYSDKEQVHKKVGEIARTLVKKFNIEKMTGLSVEDSITVIEDLIALQIKNTLLFQQFKNTKKRAVILPHCCRKFMDGRCKASFDTETSSYICAHCSSDCLVHQSVILIEQAGYDVFVIPGGSGVRKILQKKRYEGVIGIACNNELKLALDILEDLNIPAQCIPLVKNGCSQTQFNIDTLKKLLVQ